MKSILSNAYCLGILVAFLFAIPHALWAATYYVSNEGNDAANGLSTGTPWQTIAKVSGGSFAPGDTILFRRGDLWREELAFPSSGTNDESIVIGAYGSGAKPIISAADYASVFTSLGWSEAVSGLFTSGIESGGTADFNSITVNGTNTVIASDTVTNNGNFSLETTFSGVGGDESARVNKTLAASDDVYARAYFYFDPDFDLAAVDSRLDILYLKFDSSTNRARVSVLKNGAGNFYLQGRIETPSAATFYAGSPGEIVPGQWYAIELRYKGNDAVSGGVELWLDNASLASNYGFDTSGLTIGRVEIGANSSSQTNPTTDSKIFIDDIKVSTSSVGLFVPEGAPDIYYASNITWNARQVVVDDRHMTQVLAYEDIDEDTYYRDAGLNRLYVQLADGEDPNQYGAEISRRSSAVSISNKAYINIQDIALESNNNASFGGLSLIGSNNVVAINMQYQKNFGSGVVLNSNSDDNTISSSTFESNDRDFGGGVRIEGGSDDNIVEYNTMSGLINGERSGNGINVRGGETPTERNILRYNLIHDMRDSGIYVTTNANDTQIYNNVIYAIDDHSAGSSGGNGIHIGNTADAFAYARGNIIYNNLVYDVATHGISLREGSYDSIIYNNTVFNTGVNRGANSGNVASGSGIDLHSSSDTVETGASNNRIFNNIVSTCATACLNVDEYSVSAGGNELGHNLYYQPAGTLIKWNGVSYNSLAAYQAVSLQDQNSVAENPLFTDTDEADFTLQNLSPARNAGISSLGDTYRLAFSETTNVPTILGLLSQDDYGSAWEIGAFVFSESTVATPVSETSKSTATRRIMPVASVGDSAHFSNGKSAILGQLLTILLNLRTNDELSPASKILFINKIKIILQIVARMH